MHLQTQRFRHYAALMRLNRPVGIWLLLWPCWWSVALASDSMPNVLLLVLFMIGATCMRSAGCIVNDIADRQIDAQVERTKNRPLASGAVSLPEALLLLAILLFFSLLIVLQMHPQLLYYAIGSLVFVAAYPFMKRITYWPQAFLGLTFNLGALFGWVAVQGALDWPALWLYLSGICWTIAYDTIYAHQDIEDDLRIGVKSTAIRFGAHNKQWIGGFFAASLAMLAIALISVKQAGFFAYAVMPIAAAHFYWQWRTFRPNQPILALKLFKSNALLGFIISLLLIADRLLIPWLF